MQKEIMFLCTQYFVGEEVVPNKAESGSSGSMTRRSEELRSQPRREEEVRRNYPKKEKGEETSVASPSTDLPN